MFGETKETYIILENDALRSEKMSNMYKAKSALIDEILESDDNDLIATYCLYKSNELTLDEFIVALVKICGGETFKNVIFTYMLSIIAVNEEASRVAEEKRYIVE